MIMVHLVLIVYGCFLILGGFMGLKKGSKVSLIMGATSGILIFAGLWAMSFAPKAAYIFISCLLVVLALMFISRLAKTRAFMPSGMLLLITLVVLTFWLVPLLHAW